MNALPAPDDWSVDDLYTLDGLGHDPTQVKSLTNQSWLYTNTSS